MNDDLGFGRSTEEQARIRFERATLAFLGLAVALRLVRYLLNFPMWCDETMVAVNLLDRSWLDLARPLEYRQVAPIGFLALEWLATRLFGFSEMALRLVPALASLLSAPLFLCLARRVLGRSSPSTMLAMGLFAVSSVPIRYASEVKPYSLDLCVTLLLIVLAMDVLEKFARYRWLVLAVPFSVGLSLPSLFVLAAVGCVGGLVAWKQRRPGEWLGYAGFLASVGASVGLLAWLGQFGTADIAYFERYWAGAFPPSIGRPGALVSWVARTHLGPLMAYPHGEISRLGWLTGLTLAGFLAGLFRLARRDRRTLALLVLPFGFAIAASALRRYPYGMSARISQFLAPSILIATALGLSGFLQLARRPVVRTWACPVVAALLVGFGGWRLAADLQRPYRTPWDRTARDFARWFWEELAGDGELVCAQADLGLRLKVKDWTYDGTDQYLCYQRIYSQRHRDHRPPRWEAISADHPLRLVLIQKRPEQVPSVREWLDRHANQYTIRDVRSYPATRGSSAEPAITYFVCELVPTEAVSARTSTPAR